MNAIVVIPSHPWSWTISNLNKPLKKNYPENYVKQKQGTLTFHESGGGCSYKKKSFFCFLHLGFVEGCWSPIMEGDKYYEELGVAVRVVHLACSLCQRVQEGLVSMSSDQVKSKDDDSPVTVAGMYLRLKSLLSTWGLFFFFLVACFECDVFWIWCVIFVYMLLVSVWLLRNVVLETKINYESIEDHNLYVFDAIVWCLGQHFQNEAI